MITIKLEDEFADKIVVEALKDDYRMVKNNIADFKIFHTAEKVKPHILEDFEYNKKVLKALKRVLAFHMTHDDYKAFIQETK
jgi:hypothetical protein